MTSTCRAVLAEYQNMEFDSQIVVTTNLAKKLDGKVEVITGLPAKNPKSLPFAHKRIFAERLEAYDLFLYAEDDILITQRNLHAYLRASQVLPPDRLANFFRTESDATGKLYFPDVHKHYHWDAASVDKARWRRDVCQLHERARGMLCALGEQLRRAISSGGFLLPPREGKYAMLEMVIQDLIIYQLRIPAES